MTDLRLGSSDPSGLRLFSVFGIEIRLDLSVLLIFSLIVYSLGAGLFPQWHPDWSAERNWVTAFGAGVMFFASLLAHELSHSLVARMHGIRVPRITLFLFGGVAEIESEAETPRAEFLIAAAGPLLSLVLAGLFGAFADTGMSASAREALFTDPEAAVAGLGPLVTASLWLSSVNFMLAVFNLIPGFPLDGGRLFRALVWWLTGDHLLATRLASTGGRWFGWGLMALGLWRLFGGGDVGGLWFVLIGWFLSHLATSSYTQTVAQRTLRSLKIGDLMRTRFETVPVSLNVEDFVENYLLRSNQLLWPVTDGQQVLGLVAIANVADIPLIERSQRSVGEVMSLLSNMPVIDAGALATQALGPLFAAGDAPVGVVRDGQFVGLVRGSDVLRWITLHRDLAKHSSEDLRA